MNNHGILSLTRRRRARGRTMAAGYILGKDCDGGVHARSHTSLHPAPLHLLLSLFPSLSPSLSLSLAGWLALLQYIAESHSNWSQITETSNDITSPICTSIG